MPSWTATAAGLLEAVAAEPVAPHDGARAEPVTVPGADAAAALLPKGPASHGVRPRPNCHGDRDRNRCLGRGLPLVERSRPPVPSLAAPQAPPPQALELVSSSWALGLVVRYGASGSLVERSWRSRGRSTKRCGSGSSRCCQSIGPARAARSHSATGSVCRASCSCSTPVSTGSTCHPSSASDQVSPAGGDSAAGARPESGIAFTECCSRSCTRSERSTGPRSVSTAPMSGPKKGGAGTGPPPVDRSRPGSKHHIACDSAGIPLPPAGPRPGKRANRQDRR